MNPLFFYPGMLVLGVGVGLISAALGLGGGILMVPAFLTFVPAMDPHTAKGTSLLIIVFVAAVNVWRLNRGHDNWQWRLALQVSFGSIAGGYLGGWVTQFFDDRVVIWIFIVLLGLAGLRTFFIEPPKVSQDEVRSHNTLAIIIGFLMGLASGLSGIGGGAVLVPLALIAGITS
ncbi:MAG: sulfite exporter TauE/SafE family protein, partial [Candidatus Hydrogenedentota bacterium]